MMDDNTLEIQIESLTQKIETLEVALEEAKNKELRALADLQNFQRREAENKVYWSRDAVCSFLIPLLPRLGELEKSKEHTQDTDVQKTIENFLNLLQKMGLHKISPIPKEPVNTEYHEVLLTEPGKGRCIVQVLESGWGFQDRVITPAKVSAGAE